MTAATVFSSLAVPSARQPAHISTHTNACSLCVHRQNFFNSLPSNYHAVTMVTVSTHLVGSEKVWKRLLEDNLWLLLIYVVLVMLSDWANFPMLFFLDHHLCTISETKLNDFFPQLTYIHSPQYMLKSYGISFIIIKACKVFPSVTFNLLHKV